MAPTDEPIEVEVVCPRHFGPESGLSKRCDICGDHAGFTGGGKAGTVHATLRPGSVDDLRYRVGWAAEQLADQEAGWNAVGGVDEVDLWDLVRADRARLDAALAALTTPQESGT